jgi:hypothetical protein
MTVVINQQPKGTTMKAMTDETIKKIAEGIDRVRVQNGLTVTRDDEGKAAEPLDKILEHLGSMAKKMDAMCEKHDATAKRLDNLEKVAKSPPEGGGENPENDDNETDEGKSKEGEVVADRQARHDRSLADRMAVDSAEARAEFANIQARTDAVLNMHGLRAAAPMVGETMIAYRRRMLKDVQRTCAKNAPGRTYVVDSLDGANLDQVERHIFADAMTEAQRPTDIAAGQLREVRKSSEAGHRVSEFYGEPKAWMDPIGNPAGGRRVTTFLKDGHPL